jgi:hypothetical protein
MLSELTEIKGFAKTTTVFLKVNSHQLIPLDIGGNESYSHSSPTHQKALLLPWFPTDKSGVFGNDTLPACSA